MSTESLNVDVENLTEHLRLAGVMEKEKAEAAAKYLLDHFVISKVPGVKA